MEDRSLGIFPSSGERKLDHAKENDGAEKEGIRGVSQPILARPKSGILSLCEVTRFPKNETPTA